MIGEAFMGLNALNAAINVAKGMKDMNDAVVRNAAIIELQQHILNAQAAQQELIKRTEELEKKIARFDAWDAEKKRYQMKDFGGGTIAYELKADEANGQPLHRICPNCYQERRLSILQPDGRNASKQEMYSCPGCNKHFKFGVAQERNLGARDSRGWT
ncbi:MAG TPA: hypothetical protein VIR04_05245 [Paralcaligenes sp.]|jgi:hypothetical protein